MIIYPAIDIRDGKCVRLTQGDFSKEKVYFEKPEEVARMWEEKGAKILHIVDLDGALEGRSKNLHTINKIVQNVNIPVQVGGGIRSIKAISELINIGVDRVILGTKALQDRDMVKEALDLYGDKIVIGIDAKEGYVAIDGWTRTSNVRLTDFALDMEIMGAKTIIYTDIAKDGMLQGPDFAGIVGLQDRVSIDIIASGGVRSTEDVDKLSKMNVAGVIIGKALYEGKISLEEIEVDM